MVVGAAVQPQHVPGVLTAVEGAPDHMALQAESVAQDLHRHGEALPRRLALHQGAVGRHGVIAPRQVVTGVHSPEEAAQVVECDSLERLQDELLDAMSTRKTVVTIYTTDQSIDETAISYAVESAYYEHPGSILYIPTYTVAAYPETGAEQILEVALTYPYATSTVESRGAERD